MSEKTAALLNALFAAGWSVEIEPYEMTYGGTVNLWRIGVSHKIHELDGSGIGTSIDDALLSLRQRFSKMMRTLDLEAL